jgi:hypothetical protein
VSALDRPAEVLLVAFFDAADAAEAAGRAFLHSGGGADHVALLARDRATLKRGSRRRTDAERSPAGTA